MSKSRAKPIIDVSATEGESHHREDDPMGNAARTLGVAKERASETLETTRAWIVENPAAAIGIAVGAGFIVGRMVRR
jgi:ElaB/YqjD/DUF883 family membrane-anchored ribosome-binding protein